MSERRQCECVSACVRARYTKRCIHMRVKQGKAGTRARGHVSAQASRQANLRHLGQLTGVDVFG